MNGSDPPWFQDLGRMFGSGQCQVGKKNQTWSQNPVGQFSSHFFLEVWTRSGKTSSNESTWLDCIEEPTSSNSRDGTVQKNQAWQVGELNRWEISQEMLM